MEDGLVTSGSDNPSVTLLDFLSPSLVYYFTIDLAFHILYWRMLLRYLASLIRLTNMGSTRYKVSYFLLGELSQVSLITYYPNKP